MIKAIFFDIDGTLFSHTTRCVPESALQALARARAGGIKLYVATGRFLRSAVVMREWFDFDGYVSMNGQYCIDREGEVLHARPFSRDEVAQAAAHVGRWPFPVWYVTARHVYINNPSAEIVRRFQLMREPMPPAIDAQTLLQKTIYQMNIFPANDAQRDEYIATFPQFPATKSTPECYDVLPPGGGKHRGVEAVMRHLGLAREEVMAFGDGPNDVEMLEFAGTGVAMGGGCEEVKPVAQYLTGTPDEGGIAQALEHFGVI